MGRKAIKTLVCMSLLTFASIQAAAQCPGDTNGSGEVTVDEIVASINSALNGCAEPSFAEKSPRLLGNWEIIIGEETVVVAFGADRFGGIVGTVLSDSRGTVRVLPGSPPAFDFLMFLEGPTGCIGFGMSENRKQLSGLFIEYRSGCRAQTGRTGPFFGLPAS